MTKGLSGSISGRSDACTAFCPHDFAPAVPRTHGRAFLAYRAPSESAGCLRTEECGYRLL